MVNEIMIRAKKEEKEEVQRAAELMSLPTSAFARSCTLKEAKRVLKEFGQSKEVDSENE